MLAKPLRTKRQRASAERCVRPLGAMIAMATPIVKTSELSSEGRIFASRFTKRQVRYRGGYEVLSTSGNCWQILPIDAHRGRIEMHIALVQLKDLIGPHRTGREDLHRTRVIEPIQ